MRITLELTGHEWVFSFRTALWEFTQKPDKIYDTPQLKLSMTNDMWHRAGRPIEFDIELPDKE
jgi:hypothetical protein